MSNWVRLGVLGLADQRESYCDEPLRFALPVAKDRVLKYRIRRTKVDQLIVALGFHLGLIVGSRMGVQQIPQDQRLGLLNGKALLHAE